MTATEKAVSLIKSRSDAALLIEWKLLDSMKITNEVATVRGWMLDELNKRYPEAFDAWMESEDPNADITDFLN